MLRITDGLLAAKPELLPEYVEVAKGKGTVQYSTVRYSTLPKSQIPPRAQLPLGHAIHAWHKTVYLCCADSPGLMYAVLHYGIQHPDQLAPHQQDLLRMYCDTILGAKTPVAAEKLDGYAPLLAQLSQDQFKGTVLPAAQKYVKRTPEAALVSMKALFQALQLDLSSSVPDVIDQLLKLIRGSKESVRYSPYGSSSCLSAEFLILTRLF